MRKIFPNGQVHHYFLLILVLILGILAFYLSCKSKSPTEANVPSNDALAAQGTNNTTQTTTISSSTTTINPTLSPTSTTTLITSRTLTTTSIRTTTTSTSIPTTTTTIPLTTTLKPTTTISSTTTTATEWCDIRWPRKPYNAGGYVLINGNRYYHNDTYYATAGEQISVKVKICNYGSLDYNNYSYIAISYADTMWHLLFDYYESFTPFPPGGSSSCKKVRTPAPFPLTDNGYLEILFVGINHPMMPERDCSSFIYINIQIY